MLSSFQTWHEKRLVRIVPVLHRLRATTVVYAANNESMLHQSVMPSQVLFCLSRQRACLEWFLGTSRCVSAISWQSLGREGNLQACQVQRQPHICDRSNQSCNRYCCWILMIPGQVPALHNSSSLPNHGRSSLNDQFKTHVQEDSKCRAQHWSAIRPGRNNVPYECHLLRTDDRDSGSFEVGLRLLQTTENDFIYSSTGCLSWGRNELIILEVSVRLDG